MVLMESMQLAVTVMSVTVTLFPSPPQPPLKTLRG